jgi:FkbM family methyltransferase
MGGGMMPLAILRRLLGRAEPTAATRALARIAGRGLDVSTVIDVGASDGRWSEQAERFWPEARFHLIEAFDHWRPALDTLAARKPHYSYTLAAAGSSEGEVSFTNSKEDPFGGAASSSAVDTRHWKVPMVSIDGEVKRLNLRPPFLVKLDTHGFEREIIAGARDTLRSTNLFINEFYNFQSEERRWPQMVVLIEGLGFRCVDMIEPMWRSHDGAFWQVDFAFIRRDRKEFAFDGFR